LKISSGEAYQQLLGVIYPLFDAKEMNEDLREKTEILVWSIVHSYASLLMIEYERNGAD